MRQTSMISTKLSTTLFNHLTCIVASLTAACLRGKETTYETSLRVILNLFYKKSLISYSCQITLLAKVLPISQDNYQ